MARRARSTRSLSPSRASVSFPPIPAISEAGLRLLRNWGRRRSIPAMAKLFWTTAFFVMACCVPEVATAGSRVHASPHRHSCAFLKARSVRLSKAPSPYRMSARSVGSWCDTVTIMSDISDREGRSVWREGLRLSTFEGAERHVSPARVRELVRRWSTIENTGDAPMWSKGSARPQPRSIDDQTVYLTTLRREDYEQFAVPASRWSAFRSGLKPGTAWPSCPAQNA
jgi:hypothetical protein